MLTDADSLFFVVVRNSRHSSALALVDNGSSDGEEAKTKNEPNDGSECNDDDDSIHHRTSIPIVRLVEVPQGMYKLDFLDSSNDDFVASFVSTKTYLAQSDWNNLHTFASLLGKADILKQPANSSPDQPPSFLLLEDDVREVIHTFLPLEKLFSWNVLVEARQRGDLTWRYLRGVISQVRANVPFLTKDGLILHLTFHQFVALARLIHHHLETIAKTLPNVGYKVQASTSTADVQLKSNNGCVVQIAVVFGGDEAPTAIDIASNQDDRFVSWQSIDLTNDVPANVRIRSLKPNTPYDVYLRFEKRPKQGGLEAVVSSNDTDVLNSRISFHTDQTEHIFPTLDALSRDDQKTELLASIKDMNVRKQAQLSGHAIPKDADFSSDEWTAYFQWWRDNDGSVRDEFCTRELLFAASDKDIKRSAERDGIAMSERLSKDSSTRRLWKQKFCAWYYGNQAFASPAKEASTELAPSSFNVSPSIFTHDFALLESARSAGVVRCEQPRLGSFHNTVLRAKPKDESGKTEKNSQDVSVVVCEEDHNTLVSKGEEESGMIPIHISGVSKTKQKQTNPSKEPAHNGSTGHGEVVVTSVSEAKEASGEHAASTYSISTYDVAATSNNISMLESVEDSAKVDKPNPPDHDVSKPDDSTTCKLESPPYIESNENLSTNDDHVPESLDLVPEPTRLESQRRKFLNRLSTRINKAVSNVEKLSGGSSQLRGIELFRSKVKLVMFHQRLSSERALEEQLQNVTKSVESVDIFQEFDESIYDFGARKRAKKKNAELKQVHPETTKKAKLLHTVMLTRRAFSALLDWKRKRMAERLEVTTQSQGAQDRETCRYNGGRRRHTFLYWRGSRSEGCPAN
mmetsp:Transcript_15173/g.32807  ORF Transcript_15173/g.32807 Transcript_15173/m.32807 type:complete len:857 (+) Transcript_15173:228-2798(+)